MPTTYTTKQGDLWDTIALELYGSEKHCGLLMEANAKHLDTLAFPAGVVLAVPDNPDTDSDVPPSPLIGRASKPTLPSFLSDGTDYGGRAVPGDHSKLDNRNIANQHEAQAILYKTRPLDAALESIEGTVKDAAKKPYVHPQPTAAKVWHIIHNLGTTVPDVKTFDADGRVVVGFPDYDHSTEDSIDVIFANPRAGRAIVRR